MDHSAIKKILVMRWGSMGDLVICSAVIEDIHNAFPDAELSLNVEPPWHQLYTADPRFTQLIAQPIRKGNRLKTTLAWLKMIRREKFDLIIDLQCNDRSRLLLSLATLCGIAPRYRVSTRSGFPYNIATEPYPVESHALRYLRAPLLALDIPCHTETPVIHCPAEIEAQLAERQQALSLVKKQYAILIPGSSAAGAKKRWGRENFSATGRALLAEGNQHILLLGGPDEIELCQQVADDIGPQCINLCGQTGLLELIPLAKDASGVVSNDTGVAHLCAAADLPMVVICGPTLATRVKPIGPRVSALQIDPNCFNQQDAESCMKQISVEQVIHELKQL